MLIDIDVLMTFTTINKYGIQAMEWIMTSLTIEYIYFESYCFRCTGERNVTEVDETAGNDDDDPEVQEMKGNRWGAGISSPYILLYTFVSLVVPWKINKEVIFNVTN